MLIKFYLLNKFIRFLTTINFACNACNRFRLPNQWAIIFFEVPLLALLVESPSSVRALA